MRTISCDLCGVDKTEYSTSHLWMDGESPLMPLGIDDICPECSDDIRQAINTVLMNKPFWKKKNE